MTRKELWTKIGNAFATPVKERAEGQEWVTQLGLCEAWLRISQGVISIGDAERLVCNLGGIHKIRPVYWLPARCDSWTRRYWTPYCDEVRANFAYLMAELSDKEYTDLLEAK